MEIIESENKIRYVLPPAGGNNTTGFILFEKINGEWYLELFKIFPERQGHGTRLFEFALLDLANVELQHLKHQ